MNNIKQMPDPQKDLAFPLMKALEVRRSKRKWTSEPIFDQDLSNLLWAACGISEKKTEKSKQKRTAPSATNCQEIKIYVAKEDGLYLYDEINHQLILTLTEDIRDQIGTQKMMKSAPIGLIFVSDYSKFKIYLAKDEIRKWFVSGTDTGFISQNIYLYCAAARLSTTILGLVNREKLGNIIGLSSNEKVVYTQVIGNVVIEKT